MYPKPESKSLKAICLSSGTIAALALVALITGFAFDAAAQRSTGNSTGSDQQGVQEGIRGTLAQYVPAGYSLSGPFQVLSATPDAVKFYSGRAQKPRVLDLKGARVDVRDESNGSLSFATLVDGVTVWVSRSADKKSVIFFVVPSVRKENSNV